MNDQVPGLLDNGLDEFATDRLDELLSLYFDDCLSEDQQDELNALLANDPDARTRSLDAAQLHADLRSFFGQARGVSEAAAALDSLSPKL